MDKLRQKIEDLVIGDNSPEHAKWISDKLINEVLKPIAMEAYDEGRNYTYLENGDEDWNEDDPEPLPFEEWFKVVTSIKQ